MLVINRGQNTISASKVIKPLCVVDLNDAEAKKLMAMYSFLKPLEVDGDSTKVIAKKTKDRVKSVKAPVAEVEVEADEEEAEVESVEELEEVKETFEAPKRGRGKKRK